VIKRDGGDWRLPAYWAGSAAVAAWAYLTAAAEISRWLDQPYLSGAYNLILAVFTVSVAALVVRALERSPGFEASGARGFRLELRPRWVTARMGAVAAALASVHLFDYALKRLVAFEYQRVMPLFDLARERNVPTMFSSLLLGSAGMLLWGIARSERARGRPVLTWGILAVLFGFLAIDEMTSIHETMTRPSSGMVREWILVYGVLLVVLMPWLWTWLRRLPARTVRLASAAAGVYLGGAVGLEVTAGTYPRGTVARDLCTWLEEVLEIAGVLTFVFALLDFWWAQYGGLILETPIGATRPNDSESSLGSGRDGDCD